MQVPNVHNDYKLVEITPGFGFTLILEKVREESLKHGFSFNLLVVGRRGLGTKTLINSLFSSQLVEQNRPDSITTTYNEIYENNVKLAISVTTYHGEDFTKIYKLLENNNLDYFEKEQGLNVEFEDKRIHCILYLVPADKISKSEIEGVKELSKRANLIPVITKADMFTVEELQTHRLKVCEIFNENEITIFDYNENNYNNFPMATIASETVFEEDGCEILGRKYPWGYVDITNESYSDFKKLQNILITEYFEELKESTDVKFYSHYRSKIIESEGKTFSKERSAKLLLQMEKAIDEKFTSKIQSLENQLNKVDGDINEGLIVKTSEISAN